MSYAKIASSSTHSAAAPVPVPAAPVPAAPVSAAHVPAAPVPATPAPVPAAPVRITTPSVCIPRVPNGWSDGVIEDVMENDVGYGKVSKVDMINKTDRNGNEYTMAFIHFKEWASTEEAMVDRDKLLNNEKIKVVYDEADEKYFTISKSYAKRRLENTSRESGGGYHGGSRGGIYRPQRKHRAERTPRIVLDDDGWNTVQGGHEKWTTSVNNVTSELESYNETPDPNKRRAKNGFSGLYLDNHDSE